MYRRLYARCDLALRLTARSPILVQGAQAPTGAATFYRARDPADDGREKYCIPATTLKGVWRSTAERILRSFEDWLACDPFADTGEGQSCSRRLEKADWLSSAKAYEAQCPACRLFGSTVHAGLLSAQDAWSVRAARPLLKKTGIAIDRFTGGVTMKNGHGALHQVEVAPVSTTLCTALTIHNPELWQIGLLALAFRELSEGRATVGSGARRGLGWLRADVVKVNIAYARGPYEAVRAGGPDTLCSARVLAQPAERVHAADDLWPLPGLTEIPSAGWHARVWSRFEINDPAQIHALLAGCVEQSLAPRLKQGRAGFGYAILAAERPGGSREENNAAQSV